MSKLEGCKVLVKLPPTTLKVKEDAWSLISTQLLAVKIKKRQKRLQKTEKSEQLSYLVSFNLQQFKSSNQLDTQEVRCQILCFQSFHDHEKTKDEIKQNGNR